MTPSLGECSGDSTAAIPVRVSVHSAGSEFGVRLRYEVRREFAPSAGASCRASFGRLS